MNKMFLGSVPGKCQLSRYCHWCHFQFWGWIRSRKRHWSISLRRFSSLVGYGSVMCSACEVSSWQRTESQFATFLALLPQSTCLILRFKMVKKEKMGKNYKKNVIREVLKWFMRPLPSYIGQVDSTLQSKGQLMSCRRLTRNFWKIAWPNSFKINRNWKHALTTPN